MVARLASVWRRFFPMVIAVVATVSSLEAAEKRRSPAVERHSAHPRTALDDFHLSALNDLFENAENKAESGFCATSPALDRYMEGLYRIAQARRAARESTDSGNDAATEAVRMRDGIWIVEADDTILFQDNPQDIIGKSLQYTPAGNGYDVTVESFQYDPEIGVLAIDNAPSRFYTAVSLDNFAFPFGGGSYSTLWVGTDLGIRTSTPLGVALFAWEQYTVTSSIADLFTDRGDRLSPLYYARGDNWGRYVYVKDTPEKLLVTWRTALDSATQVFFVDVQAALFPDGRILYSYQTLKGVDNGAPYVYPGITDWIGAFETKMTTADPLDASPPIADIIEVILEEDPVGDVIHLRLTVAETIPESYPQKIAYKFTLSQQGQPVYFFLAWVDGGGRSILYRFVESLGRAYVKEAPATFNGSSWDVLFSLSDFPDLVSGALEITAETEVDDQVVDTASASTTITGGTAFARDYTAETPFSSSIPIVESFIYPWFMPAGVKDKLLAHTGWDETRIDGMPMYQDFFTDLILWAGAYYSYGNCGAANIGRCDPADVLKPGLLHMNKTNFGNWNHPDTPKRFTVLSHEFGHHWLQLVDIDEGAGPTNVLNPVSPHPAGYVHTEAVEDIVTGVDSSVMGGAFWTDNGNGTYSTQSTHTYYSYSAYELYLMGLMDPSEVIDWFYLDNTDPPQPRAYWPEPNTTVTGEYKGVTIEMLTDAMGFREPAYPDSRSSLFAPLVLVVRPGQEPSEADWTFMMSLRDPWRERFRLQTNFRATLATISPREVSPVGASPLRIEKRPSDSLRLYFEDPQFGDQVLYNVYEAPLSATFDTWAPSSCGEVPAETGAGELFLDVTPPLPSQSYYYLVTMSNSAFEGSPGTDSTGATRTTTSPRCGAQ